MEPLCFHQVLIASATNTAWWINLRQIRLESLERTEQSTERPRWSPSGFWLAQGDSTRMMFVLWQWMRAGTSMPWFLEELTSLWSSVPLRNSPISTNVASHMSLKDPSSLSANRLASCSVDKPMVSRSGVLEKVSQDNTCPRRSDIS